MAPSSKSKNSATRTAPTLGRRSTLFETLRKPHPERGWDMDFVHWNQNEYLLGTIKTHGWTTFCAIPEYGIHQLVELFYDNLHLEQDCVLRIKGKNVSFTHSTINRIYELQDIDSPEEFSQSDVSHVNWDVVTNALCGKVVRMQNKTLPMDSMLPLYKCWAYFINSRLIPTMHVGTITEDRVMLIYWIAKRKPVDVGRLINASLLGIKDSILEKKDKKHRGTLFFPGLLTCLMEQAGVKAPKGGVVIAPGPTIDQNFTKMMGRSRSKKRKRASNEAELNVKSEAVPNALTPEHLKNLWIVNRSGCILMMRIAEKLGVPYDDLPFPDIPRPFDESCS